VSQFRSNKILPSGATKKCVDVEDFATVTWTRLCVPKIVSRTSILGAGGLTYQAGGLTVSE
jgi:hypothetical protein